ncbi:hypothetical protein [Hymenobacter siberiensis]|uniref:hypothetical protein n=1 Tax=Hymenobacter siberiensis TaxID=2848396 RepID=UPI001D03485B|nr:hypothetical protein [Hymenobacter siberiensis]
MLLSTGRGVEIEVLVFQHFLLALDGDDFRGSDKVGEIEQRISQGFQQVELLEFLLVGILAEAFGDDDGLVCIW